MPKNWNHAAGILWQVLIALADKKVVTTYGELARRISTGNRNVRLALGPIQDFCRENSLPPLTVLVVNKKTGNPGAGFIDPGIGELKDIEKAVHDFKWKNMQNPFSGFGPEDTIESFAQTLIDKPEQAADIYARVKVRGPAQKIFRHVLLKAYNRQCAMCGFSFVEALEAAHIVPWSKCKQAAQRISPNNGILLCANHHMLFDKRRITVTQKYKIEWPDKKDRQASILLNGKQLRLPKDEKLYPDPDLLRTRKDRK
ncbi:HNH endonuclease [Candidatus Spongiihabitans sp.]|uniref:HNH endonuclease n=1 Tax=Candidatus Spongiihabitans sp. TaxID=3101308 RepID=UPI003C7D3B75